jgi:hypothetical protein
LRFSSLRRHQGMLVNNGERLLEITDSNVPARLRPKPPPASHRFARWKWLIPAFTVLNMLGFLLSLVHSLN